MTCVPWWRWMMFPDSLADSRSLKRRHSSTSEIVAWNVTCLGNLGKLWWAQLIPIRPLPTHVCVSHVSRMYVIYIVNYIADVFLPERMTTPLWHWATEGWNTHNAVPATCMACIFLPPTYVYVHTCPTASKMICLVARSEGTVIFVLLFGPTISKIATF